MKETVTIMVFLLSCSLICTAQDDIRSQRKYPFNIEALTEYAINLNLEKGFTNLPQSKKDSSINFLKKRKYIEYKIQQNLPFKIKLIDTTRNNILLRSLRIIQSPNSIYENEYKYSEFKERFSNNITFLNKNEELFLELYLDTIPSNKLNSKSIQKIVEIHITTEVDKPNDSYLIISLIKSIYGERPNTELLDFNTKFNYTDNWFSMLSLEVDMGVLDKDNNSDTLLFEGISNLNRYLNIKSVDNKRKIYFGTGMKIFNSRLLYGAHFGSIEIDGKHFSSYFLLGYYLAVYNPRVIDPIINEHRHNLYLEIAYNIGRDDIPIVKDLRLKIGFLMPCKKESDFNARIVLEFPIGGVIRF